MKTTPEDLLKSLNLLFPEKEGERAAAKKLRIWLKSGGWTNREFAELMMVTPETFSRWLGGKTTPGIHRAIAISILTEGAVPARDWCISFDGTTVDNKGAEKFVKKWRTKRAKEHYDRRFSR